MIHMNFCILLTSRSIFSAASMLKLRAENKINIIHKQSLVESDWQKLKDDRTEGIYICEVM